LLVVGGLREAPYDDNEQTKATLRSAELYDPAAGSWSVTGSSNSGRYGHTVTLLANGHVLVVGGFAGLGSKSAELYDLGFETPLLTLDSTTYCVGDPWGLTVTHAERSSFVRLLGISSGIAWEIARWGDTDVDGSFTANGTMVSGTEGSHTLTVESNRVRSSTVSFLVSNCKP
jgi:hypothetical protein